MDNNNEIKNELQGSGFLEEVKEKRLPDSTVLTGAALEKYVNNHGEIDPERVNKQADQILRRLLEYESEIYTEREQRVYREALVVFMQEKYDTGQTSLNSYSSTQESKQFTEYPHLQELFSEIEAIYEGADGFSEAFREILPLLYPPMDAISVSAQQSRRKRAGSSLRRHIENLLQEAGYETKLIESAGNGYLYQLQMQRSESTARLYISYLTTLRDRFRQSLSDGNISDLDAPRYILTGAGNNIFTSSSNSGVTDQKVNEIIEEGFTLVVFDSVKEGEHQGNEHVISYTELFSESVPSLFEPSN
jgi:hypothetical protein